MFALLKKYFSPFANPDEELCLLEILKPLYVLLSALGLFPCAVKFPDGIRKTNKLTSKDNMINGVCTLFLIILIHGFFVLHLLELNVASQDNPMTEGTMTIINYIIDLVAQVLFCTVTYFRVIRDRRLYITMLNDMVECWSRLAKGQKRPILGRLRVQVNCVVLGSLSLISLVLMAVTLTGAGVTTRISTWKMLLVTVTFSLAEIIQFTVIAFYFVMILIIVALLKNIEEQFRVHMRLRNVRDDVKLDLGVDMADIRDVYVKTMSLKRQINKAFQAPILVALLVSFHELVSMPHMVYHALSFQSNFSTQDVVECLCWFLNQLVKIYALAYSGTLLKSQVNKIGRTIHIIPINEKHDLPAFFQVQHFSSMITFQDAKITVYGYFPLDATLMFNIVASATMYLVILVQLDK